MKYNDDLCKIMIIVFFLSINKDSHFYCYQVHSASYSFSVIFACISLGELKDSHSKEKPSYKACSPRLLSLFIETAQLVNSFEKLETSLSFCKIGTKGDFNVFQSNSLNFIWTNQGCSLIVDANFNLSQGFLLSNFESKSRRFLLQFLLNSGSLDFIFSQSCPLFLEQKGGSPLTSSNIKHPKHHQSTALPCPSALITSGARYSGVPHTENLSQSPIIFDIESPKSVSLIYPLAVISIFSGLRLKQQRRLLSINDVFGVQVFNSQHDLC